MFKNLSHKYIISGALALGIFTAPLQAVKAQDINNLALVNDAIYYFQEDNKSSALPSSFVEAMKIYYDPSDRKNVRQMEILFLQLAHRGFHHAYFYLGNTYLNGDGVQENEAKAYEYFAKGLAAGNPACKYIIGQALLQGRTLKRDPRKAFELIVDAAVSGYADAQYDLALTYTQGRYVERNLQEATKWMIYANIVESYVANLNVMEINFYTDDILGLRNQIGLQAFEAEKVKAFRMFRSL